MKHQQTLQISVSFWRVLYVVMIVAIIVIILAVNLSFREMVHIQSLSRLDDFPFSQQQRHQRQDVSPVIPPDFASISLEWFEAISLQVVLLQVIDNHNNENVPSKDPNEKKRATFVRLLQYLSLQGRSPVNIRVGGDSADLAWWQDSNNFHRNKDKCSHSFDGKHCVQYNITATTIQTLLDIATETNATLILDITMMQNDTAQYAMEEIIHMLTVVQNHNNNGILEGFEIGNEPDMFDRGMRNPNYNVNQYIDEFHLYCRHIFANPQIQQLIQQIFPKHKHAHILRGGGFAYKRQFVNATATMLENFGTFLYSWSHHHYPTLACHGHKPPTAAELLSEASSSDYAATIAPLVQLVSNNTHNRRHGIPFHLGETNSAACSGLAGLSDTMTAALWALDYMFALAQVSVARLNFHGGGKAPYSWFIIDPMTGVPHVQPLYYAMFVWRYCITGDSGSGSGSKGTGSFRIIASDCRGHGCPNATPTSTSNEHNFQSNEKDNDDKGRIKIWIVRDDAMNTRVIIINKLLHPPPNATTRMGTATSNNNHTVAAAAAKHYQQGSVDIAMTPCYVVGQVSVLGPSDADMHLGLQAKSLHFSGWTWESSKAGERKGTYKPIPITPHQKDDNNSVCHYKVGFYHASVTILSLDAKDLMPRDTTFSSGVFSQQLHNYELLATY